jgi:hypothetical protein
VVKPLKELVELLQKNDVTVGTYLLPFTPPSSSHLPFLSQFLASRPFCPNFVVSLVLFSPPLVL